MLGAIWWGMMIYACNPSTQETDIQGLQAQGWPGLDGKTLSQS